MRLIVPVQIRLIGTVTLDDVPETTTQKQVRRMAQETVVDSLEGRKVDWVVIRDVDVKPNVRAAKKVR